MIVTTVPLLFHNGASHERRNDLLGGRKKKKAKLKYLIITAIQWEDMSAQRATEFLTKCNGAALVFENFSDINFLQELQRHKWFRLTS